MIQALALIRARLGPAALEEAIRTGSAGVVLERALADAALETAFAPVRQELQRTLADNVAYFAHDVPVRGALRGVAIAFDVLNPRVIDAVRRLDTRVFMRLAEDVRGTVRQVVERGLAQGVGPRTIARGLRDVVGLAPNQEAAIHNFERMLREGDRAALTRALRDHRFDRTLDRLLGVRGEGLSAAQVTRMTDAYRRNMVAFNAESNARTAALNSVKLGQRLSWQDAIDKGYVDGGNLMKRWVNVGDARVRDEHLAQPLGVAGETVPFDEPYSTGEMEPGDDTYNCRCLSFVFAG